MAPEKPDTETKKPIEMGIRVESSTDDVGGSNSTINHYYFKVPIDNKTNVYLGLGENKSYNYDFTENTSVISSVPAVDVRVNRTIVKNEQNNLQIYGRLRATNFTDKEHASAQLRAAFNYNINLDHNKTWQANIGGHVSTTFRGNKYNFQNNSNTGLWCALIYQDKKTKISATLEQQANYGKNGWTPYTNLIVTIPIGK